MIDLGAFCVELRPFYCRKRISVPMSYISFWKHVYSDTLGLRSEGYPCGPPTLKTKVGMVPLPKLWMTLIRVPTVSQCDLNLILKWFVRRKVVIFWALHFFTQLFHCFVTDVYILQLSIPRLFLLRIVDENIAYKVDPWASFSAKRLYLWLTLFLGKPSRSIWTYFY